MQPDWHWLVRACARTGAISTCMDTNEKWISWEQNSQTSAKFIINTAEPAVSPSRAACQKSAQLARKWPLGRKKPNQTKPTAYPSHEKHEGGVGWGWVWLGGGVLWARADTRLLISAAATWSSRQVTGATFPHISSVHWAKYIRCSNNLHWCHWGKVKRDVQGSFRHYPHTFYVFILTLSVLKTSNMSKIFVIRQQLEIHFYISEHLDISMFFVFCFLDVSLIIPCVCT